MPKQQVSKELLKSKDVSIPSILSACTKSSNINIPWQQLLADAQVMLLRSHIL